MPAMKCSISYTDMKRREGGAAYRPDLRIRGEFEYDPADGEEQALQLLKFLKREAQQARDRVDRSTREDLVPSERVYVNVEYTPEAGVRCKR